jgi:hypothetical protein
MVRTDYISIQPAQKPITFRSCSNYTSQNRVKTGGVTRSITQVSTRSLIGCNRSIPKTNQTRHTALTLAAMQTDFRMSYQLKVQYQTKIPKPHQGMPKSVTSTRTYAVRLWITALRPIHLKLSTAKPSKLFSTSDHTDHT